MKHILFLNLVGLFCSLTLFVTELESSATGSSKKEVSELLDLSLEQIMDITIYDMDINISSTKSETVSKSVSVVSVIDRETIERYNFLSISEALNTVPGFFSTRTYLKRDIPTIRGVLQDHYANKVLLMINNIPTWHAVTGEANIDRVNINDVERIELLKGPASVLYGTNAYAGAINIILRTPERDKNEFYTGAGSQGKINGGGSYTFKSKKGLSLYASLNRSYEKGHEQSFVDETGKSGRVTEYLNHGSFNLNGQYRKHSFLLNLFRSDESYLGVIPRYSKGADNNHRSEGLLLNYSYRQELSKRADMNYTVTYDNNQRNLSRSSDDSIRADINGYRINTALQSNIKLSRYFNMEVGADYDYRKSERYRNYNTQTNEIIAENNLLNKDVFEYSYFGQLEFNKEPYKLVLGIKKNENEFSGGHFSSRGTIVYTLTKRSSLKLIYGESYRSPSLFELNFETPTQTVFGNMSLNPETSRSFELAYLRSYKNLFLQLTGYSAKYDNQIHRVKKDVRLADGSLVSGANIYENGDMFKAKGIELELRYHNNDVADAFLNLGYVDGNNSNQEGNKDYNFRYVPDLTISCGLEKNIGRVSISGVFNQQGSTEGAFKRIGTESTIDLNLRIKPPKGKNGPHHRLSVKNLLNNNVTVPEYVRKTVNEIPLGNRQRIVYTMMFQF